MDNTELQNKLENIEKLLSANIENMNKILAHINDPKEKQKEANVFMLASQEINATTEEISALISKEKELLEYFNLEI